MEFALAFGIYLVGVITGVMIAVAVFSDRRIKIDPTEDGGQYL
jgi:hypothetical protein